MIKYELTNGLLVAFSFVVLSLLALAFLWRRKKNATPEFNLSGLDENELAFINDNLEDRLEEHDPGSLDKLIREELKAEPFWFGVMVVLQVVTAALTATYWMKSGSGFGGTVFAAVFTVFNFAVLPYMLGKIRVSIMALPMSLIIIGVSFVAAAGLTSITTSAGRSDATTAKSDKARIVETISQKEETLLAIDKSKTQPALVSEKKSLVSQREDVFLTQVSYTRRAKRRNKSYRGVFDTLDKLTAHCAAPGPVKNAGRLCGQVRKFNRQIGLIDDKIAALDSAQNLRAEIAALEKRRDKKSTEAVSDPLAPIRSILPEKYAKHLPSLQALIIGLVIELIIDGYAYVIMTEATDKAKNKRRLARQRIFRKLKQDAYARFNPDKLTSAVPDLKLNEQLEQRLDEKLLELEGQSRAEEQRRDEEHTAMLEASREQAHELEEQTLAEEQRRDEEHTAMLEASRDDAKALKLAHKHLERAISATSDSVRGKLRPIMEYMELQVVDIEGGSVPMTVMASDYERWARLNDKPELKGELMGLLPQTGLESYDVGDMTYFANIALRSAPQIKAVS